MFVGLDEEPAGAGGRVEDHLAGTRVDLLDDEADQRTWRVELAGIASGVSHLAQHGLVEDRHRVHLVAVGELDLVHLVDELA